MNHPLVTLGLVASLMGAPLAAQNLLSGDWVFHAGAAMPAADAGRPFNGGVSWERQGCVNGGEAWLSTSFHARPEWRAAGLRCEFSLRAEKVELLINGRRVATSTVPDQRIEAVLPTDAVHWGEANRVALHIVDHQWTGGDVPDRVRIFPVAGDGAPVDFAVAPLPPQHEFAADAEVALSLHVQSRRAAPRAGAVRVRVVSDTRETLFDRSEKFTASPAGGGVPLSLGRLPPGFYAVSLRAEDDGYFWSEDFWITVAPTLVTAAPREPEGFAEFWAAARAELAATEPEFSATPQPALSTARQKVYSVEMKSVGGVRLRAWLVAPARAGRFPAIVHLPGYSVAMQPEWFVDGRDDVVHLALDIRGHGRSAGEVNPGFGLPGFVGHGVGRAEDYVYRGAYLDVGRALEFLATRPEVDAARIGVEGMSQGGGLALAAAALFPERVAACAAGVPFLGVPQEHFRVRPIYRGEIEEHLRLRPARWEEALRSLEMVNTWHLAPRVTCPVFMAVALGDDDCPARIGFSVYNRITAPKSYRIFPRYGHLMNGEWPATAAEWLRARLRAGE